MKHPTHCNCNSNTSNIKGTCPNCSRVKIAVMRKNNHQNKVWFSFYAKNNASFNEIALKMWDKLKVHPNFTAIQNTVNVVIAYDRFENNKMQLK